MRVKLQKVAVSRKYLTLGMVADYGGAVRFFAVKVPIEDLVDTDLYGQLGKAAQRRADHEYNLWVEDQDRLFD